MCKLFLVLKNKLIFRLRPTQSVRVNTYIIPKLDGRAILTVKLK